MEIWQMFVLFSLVYIAGLIIGYDMGYKSGKEF